MRLIVARLATAALAVLVLSALPALASRPSYALLVDAHGLRVYGLSTRSLKGALWKEWCTYATKDVLTKNGV